MVVSSIVLSEGFALPLVLGAEILQLLLFCHRQHRLGVGILSRLPPALHLLREQAPLAAVGAELGGVEARALQYNRELVDSAPALWLLLG